MSNRNEQIERIEMWLRRDCCCVEHNDVCFSCIYARQDAETLVNHDIGSKERFKISKKILPIDVECCVKKYEIEPIPYDKEEI